jgi:pimeloyl-ACP methyl ester carboxylesterase
VSRGELPVSDPPLRAFDLDGARLTYTDEGPAAAPAVVALHGIPGSVRDFRYLGAALAPRLRLVRLDLPGFGGSAPIPAGVRSLEGRARAVRALADHLGLGRYAVLGHSMGGASAMVAAARDPQRVTRLVLVNSVGLSLHRGLGLQPWVFRLMARSLRVPGLRRLLLGRVRAEYRRRRLPGADELDAAALALQLRAIAALDFALLRRAVERLPARALVAFARDDHLVEARISEELARALPGARVLEFAEGGHNLQKAEALALAQALADELAGAGPDGGVAAHGGAAPRQ